MAAQIQYDPQIIQTFAAGLYSQATNIVITYGCFGLLFGGIAGGGLGALSRESGIAMTGALVLGVLGLVLGVSAGRSRAFVLKLQAQQALCQLQIEANTRGAHQQLRAA